MGKVKLDPQKKIMAFFCSLRESLLTSENEFVEQEIVEEYNNNLRKLSNLSGRSLRFLEIGEEDIFIDNSEDNFVVPGFRGHVLDSEGTTRFKLNENIDFPKKYRKDRLMLKLGQVINLFLNSY